MNFLLVTVVLSTLLSAAVSSPAGDEDNKYMNVSSDGSSNVDDAGNIFEAWFELVEFWEVLNWSDAALASLHHSEEDEEAEGHISSLLKSESGNDTHAYVETKQIYCKQAHKQPVFHLKSLEHASKVLYKASLAQVHVCENRVHLPRGAYYVVFCGFVLLVGCALRWLTANYKLPVPYTVSLLVAGALMEVVVYWTTRDAWGDLGAGFGLVARMDPHIILVLFIPGLIFESAFSSNYHIFVKEKSQSLLLAGPGVAMNTLLTGGVMHYFNAYHWYWSFCLMFGAIVSATDPVAVVALLSQLGASKRLSTLIEAESLLNDGTAFVLYVMLATYASSDSGEQEADVRFVLVTFFQLAIGGALWGLAVGYVLYKCLANVFDDFRVETSLTLAFCYLGFYYGDIVLHVSGVLACVFLGLYTSKNKQAISSSVEHVLHHFWQMIGFVANTMLFFITGQVIAYKIFTRSTTEESTLRKHFFVHVGHLLTLYVAVHVSRALTMWQLFPVLQQTGYGCTWKEALVMVCGGLRGAIGLALALLVEIEPGFSDKQKDLVLFHVSGVVVLTLLINASSIKYLVEYLQLNKPPADTIGLFNSTVEFLNAERQSKMNALQRDLHYKGANWLTVRRLQPRYEALMQEVYGDNYLEHLRRAHAVHRQNLDDGDSQHQGAGEDIVAGNSQTDDEQKPLVSTNPGFGDAMIVHIAHSGQLEASGDVILPMPAFQGLHIIDLLEAVAREERERCEERELGTRVIQVMKASFWVQFEKGLISGDAVSVLVEAAETAIDQMDLGTMQQNLEPYFSIANYVKWMHESQYSALHMVSRSLLFSSLGFAIEVASGLVYSSKAALKFCASLRRQRVFDEALIAKVQTQLNHLAKFAAKKMEGVEDVYPEVHEAIQTSHAAHALLHSQKHQIERLKHNGYLDEADFSRFNGACDEYLHGLFRNSYGDFMTQSEETDIMVAAPLFEALTCAEKQCLKNASLPRILGQELIFEEGTAAKNLFVVTRGHVKLLAPMPSTDDPLDDAIEDALVKATLRKKGAKETTFEHLARGDVFAAFPFLTICNYPVSYMGATDKVHGFMIPFETVSKLMTCNVDFANDMWKRAAVEVIELLFRDKPLFRRYGFGGELSVENFVFSDKTRLGFYSGEDDYSAQMRLHKGPGVLLDGVCVGHSHRKEVTAPAILPQRANAYVAVSGVCVVLHMSATAKKAPGKRVAPRQSIIRLQSKLTQMFGLGTMDASDSDSESSSSSSSSGESSDDLDLDLAATSLLMPEALQGAASVGFGVVGVDEDIDSGKVFTSVVSIPIGAAKGKADDFDEKVATKPPLQAVDSLGIPQPSRFSRETSRRSGRHRHRHRRKLTLELMPEALPKGVDVEAMDKRTAFEVVKHLLSKHELFRDADRFHLHHTRTKHLLPDFKRAPSLIPGNLLKAQSAGFCDTLHQVEAASEDRLSTTEDFKED